MMNSAFHRFSISAASLEWDTSVTSERSMKCQQSGWSREVRLAWAGPLLRRHYPPAIDVVRQLVDTNLLGAVHACQAAIPVLRKQGHGHIILISSIGARLATPGAAFYYASKAAVSALAESFALEVAPLGVKVTAVEPGGMRTRFAEASSLKVIASDPDYAETVGATIAMMQSPEYVSFLGDPAGHARLLLELAGLEAPPVRILAGADAVTYGRQAGEARAVADEQWRVLGQSATVGVSAQSM